MKKLFIGFALLLLGGCSDEKTNAVSTKEASSTSATNTEDPATSTKIPTTPERLARQRNNNKGKTGADGAVTETEEKNNQQEDGKGDGDFPQETSGETPQPQVKVDNPTPAPQGEFGKSLSPLTTKPGTKITPDPIPRVEEEEKEIVFVGSFARWKKSSSVQYDGSYDAAHGLFVICQKDQCHKVSQDEILRPENGECDEPLANRIKLFRIKKNGEVDPNGNRIKIVGNKGEVMVNGNTRKINLDVPTIRRIDNAANQAEMKPKRPDADDKIVILPPTPKQQDPATIKNPPVWVKIDRDKPVEKKPVIIDPLAPKPEPKTEPQTPKKTVVKEPAQIRIPLHQPANQYPPPANKTTASTNRVQLRQPVSADTAKKIQKQ